MMERKANAPWTSGPGEILRHGLGLLKQDSDTNRRLAMIAIDNAVELAIKTYLGLPRRVTGLQITRREYAEIAESFPALLDALERYATDKLSGIDLGEIEWYHRLRNELYHQGNGLTVERDKVEIYAELANVLFKNLFGVELVTEAEEPANLLGVFLEEWIEIERTLVEAVEQRHRPSGAWAARAMSAIPRELEKEGRLSRSDVLELDALRKIRSEVIHGVVEHQKALTPELVGRVKLLKTKVTTAVARSSSDLLTPR
jgi:hypothetical protein